jgi:nucleoside-diphosphate-sugar epimerase
MSTPCAAGRGRRALVTGATGALGPLLVQRLRRDGWCVRAMARTPVDLGPGVEFVPGDVCDVAAVRRATAGMDVVFHLASKLHVVAPDPKVVPDYEAVNVEGTRAVAEAVRAQGTGRLVFFSSIVVYGSTAGRVVDEEASPRPDTVYGRTKLAAEQAALSVLPCCVLRVAAVYGPRMKGNYPRLVRALARGRFVPVGRGTNRRTLIFEDDVVEAALQAAVQDAAPGRTFNVTGQQPHTLTEIVAAICQALDRRPPRWHLPLAAARAAAAVGDGTLRALGRRPTARTAVDKLVEDCAVEGRAIGRALGFAPKWPLVDGWRRTIEAWREEGLL